MSTRQLAAPVRPLLDGGDIPLLGLGTWPLADAEALAAVASALRAGYRLIDTAARYENETGVGRAIAAAGVPRAEVFVTTKLRGAQHGYDRTIQGLDESLARLGVDYVDLYLIHWPLPGVGLFVDSWRALVDLRAAGKVRSIGVSNFTARHIEALVEATGVLPAVNQIELHPDFAQPEARAWHDAHGIVTEAWSPLGAHTDLLSHPAIAAIAASHGRTPAQIVLRWHVQIGAVPIPKSADPERMRENLAVFDFELGADDMAALHGIDRGNRIGADPDTNVEL
ncbi:MAG TPA: aldo/keto reductase [Gaiellales bacterium]